MKDIEGEQHERFTDEPEEVSDKSWANAASDRGSSPAMSSFEDLQAQDKSEPTPADKATPRAVERINFTEGWVKRFFDVLDGNLTSRPARKS